LVKQAEVIAFTDHNTPLDAAEGGLKLGFVERASAPHVPSYQPIPRSDRPWE
jgi:hypothetical protein